MTQHDNTVDEWTGLSTHEGFAVYSRHYLRSEHFTHTKAKPKYNWWKVYWNQEKAGYYVYACDEPERVFPLWVYLQNSLNERVFETKE